MFQLECSLPKGGRAPIWTWIFCMCGKAQPLNMVVLINEYTKFHSFLADKARMRAHIHPLIWFSSRFICPVSKYDLWPLPLLHSPDFNNSFTLPLCSLTNFLLLSYWFCLLLWKIGLVMSFLIDGRLYYLLLDTRIILELINQVIEVALLLDISIFIYIFHITTPPVCWLILLKLEQL